MEKEYKYIVATRCFTFNHAPYVEDALRGFAIQETTFPVVYIIVDDASKDGEPDVLRHWASENLNANGTVLWRDMPYGQLAVAPLKNKTQSTFVILLLSENHYKKLNKKFEYISEWHTNAKYNALCEGDDYWTDPYKLQKQVDFLDNHPDYTMCFHMADIKVENGASRTNYFVELEDREYTPQDIIPKWIIPTHSMVWRSNISDIWLSIMPNFIFGDDVLYASCLREGKIWGMSQKMGVYRIVPTGWMLTHKGKDRHYSNIFQRKALMKEFVFYRCEENYKYMEKRYFELMYELLKERNWTELKKVRTDYKETLSNRPKFGFQIYILKRFLSPVVNAIKRNKAS